MSASNKSLRQLARAHAVGQLSLSDYRKARTRLLEAIISGDVPVPEPDPDSKRKPPQDESTEQGEPQKFTTTGPAFRPESKLSPPEAPAAPPPEYTPPAPSMTGPLIAAGVGVILFLAGAVYLLMAPATREEPGPEPYTVAEPAADESAPVEADPMARDLILSFLRDGSWTRDSINAFLDEWQALPESERASARGSIELSRLSNAILKQMLAERALSGLAADGGSQDKQRMLADFARALGIDDPRLTLPASDAGETEESPQGDGQAANSRLPLQEPESACKAGATDESAAYCRDALRGLSGYGPTMVVIPPGNVVMGGREETQATPHRVRIDYSFALSVHEVTYGEYARYCRHSNADCPAQPWFGADYPVVNVNWHQANAYTRWLSENTGHPYRLASEAEWAYAAGAADGQVAKAQSSPGGSRSLQGPLPKSDRSVSRNAFHVYHMRGNVREWTRDRWHDDFRGAPTDGSPWLSGDSDRRVVRGGSYTEQLTGALSQSRNPLPADHADHYTGFRVVQELGSS